MKKLSIITTLTAMFVGDVCTYRAEAMNPERLDLQSQLRPLQRMKIGDIECMSAERVLEMCTIWRKVNEFNARTPNEQRLPSISIDSGWALYGKLVDIMRNDAIDFDLQRGAAMLLAGSYLGVHTDSRMIEAKQFLIHSRGDCGNSVYGELKNRSIAEQVKAIYEIFDDDYPNREEIMAAGMLWENLLSIVSLLPTEEERGAIHNMSASIVSPLFTGMDDIMLYSHPSAHVRQNMSFLSNYMYGEILVNLSYADTEDAPFSEIFSRLPKELKQEYRWLQDDPNFWERIKRYRAEGN
ncbi:MAG: hypothetical protein LBQ26_01895 [Holosporales bacterium]|jgi:hypothetical protein|nr:hypothetical protein [Holosporales bacterium]